MAGAQIVVLLTGEDIVTRNQKVLITMAAASCLVLLPRVSVAQQQPLGCEYDETMASMLCYVNNGPLVLNGIVINGGECRLWDHRLVRATLAAELRAAGQIASETDYTEQELDTISAAILINFQKREFATNDFFRFESYRCVVKRITLETSAGTVQLNTQQ
jgi:hypothetical protein